MSKLLLEENPLVILPALAIAIGLNESIVLQQLHYWLVKNKDETHFKDGRYWSFNSIRAWQVENFPFWGKSTIQRIFASLIKQGLVLTGQYNRKAYDKTLWYTIDYVKMAKLEDQIELSHIGTPCPNMTKPIPETTTESISIKGESKKPPLFRALVNGQTVLSPRELKVSTVKVVQDSWDAEDAAVVEANRTPGVKRSELPSLDPNPWQELYDRGS